MQCSLAVCKLCLTIIVNGREEHFCVECTKRSCSAHRERLPGGHYTFVATNRALMNCPDCKAAAAAAA
ncbi:MAG: hypothetical protein Hyperionvirus1_179 [Hyperionvirus sp.]|uniref:Uncharacterized protein n=1 Tax=Hyperionvirus sp. TaxID=2487770 RepID=A0A3G5A5R8_9VIRU|nr:MAG: hypothetical protein Hyperionvirus1_179 [Hyperionvirus sp.]